MTSESHSKSNYLHLSLTFLVPTLFVWVSGFLGRGANIAFFNTALNGFHSFPKVLQLVVELAFPIIAFIFALRGEKGAKRITLLILSVLLTLFTVLGLLFAPKV